MATGTNKRTYSADNGPMERPGTSAAMARITETNPLGIANAPPYSLTLSPGLRVADLVQRNDFETLAKIAETMIFNYTFEHTIPLQLSYDAVDRTYQLNITLPMDAVVDLRFLSTLYKVRSMFVTQKPWAELAQVPDPEAGELKTVQNVAICVASYQRSNVIIEDVLLMQYESDAHYCAPENFQWLDVRRADFASPPPNVRKSRPASASSAAAGTGQADGSDMNVDEKTEASDGGLPAATPDNPLRIPATRVPYRIIVPPKMTFADVVAVPDRDMLRKMAQVVFYFYKTARTIYVYVSYDAVDRAYEVTFSCPRDIRVDLDFIGSVYTICPMLVTRQPWVKAARGPNPTTGEVQVTQNLSLRFASYRRQYLTLVDTSLLMWRTKATYIPSEDEADLVRPTKRVPTLQWGMGGSTSTSENNASGKA